MTAKRIVSIALTWSLVWVVFAALSVTVLGLIDPDSIDEGEILGAIFILGPMGILTGLAFAILVSLASKRTRSFDLSLFRTLAWGVLGSALVQTGYLGHGDAGLVANLGMAVVFSAFGGIISVFWYCLVSRWARV